MAAIHPSRIAQVPGGRHDQQQGTSSMDASRQELLKRQLLERRQARASDVPPVSGSISIKGKGKEVAPDERRGMRAWSEERGTIGEGWSHAGASDVKSKAMTTEPAIASERQLRLNGDDPVPSAAAPRANFNPEAEVANSGPDSRPHTLHRRLHRRSREASTDSILAFPRTRSPSPNRSSKKDQTWPAFTDRTRWDDNMGQPETSTSRRMYENPERRAMREGYALPPRPSATGRNERIHAEPMSGADTGYSRDRRASPSDSSYDRPPHQPPQASTGGINGSSSYGYGYGRRDLPGQADPKGVSQDGDAAMTWRKPQQGGWQNPPPRRNYGPVDFEQRRLQRENSTLIVWPPSPREPYKDEEELEAERRAARKAAKVKKSKKSKRRSKYSSASSSGSESEEDRRASRHRRDKRRRRYSTSGSDGGLPDESERERGSRRRPTRSKSVSRPRSPGMARESSPDEWVEKRGHKNASEAPLTLEDLTKMQQRKEEEEKEIGPVMPTDNSKGHTRQRYEDMLPGEAEAMALFASNGLRIPRRGEIGLDTERIQQMEESGYVMSGARHKKMNAVRLRKENQVINAEEKRAILNLQREEKMKREGMIISQFRELMNSSLQQHEAKK